jgi:hypothetical protein
MIFTYQDVRDDFESIMQQWLRIAEEMRDLCDLFFSTFYGGRSFVENRFLTAVRALEVFHRQKFDGTDVPNKEHESRLKKILDSAPGEHRTWLKQKLRYSNEPTLRRRMHELLEHAGPLIDAVVRDRERFISMTVDTRNFFTHFDPASGSHVVRDPSTLHWLAERLLTLMKICLILELGVDAERCASWFNRNRRYRYLASTRSSASGA